MMNGYGMGYGAGYAILMAILWLMLFAGIVLLVMWAVRQSQRGASGTHRYEPPGHRDDACEVARMRYARGEISRDQYEEMCRVLDGRGGYASTYTPPPMNPPSNPPTYPPSAPPSNPPSNPPMAGPNA